MRFPPWRKLDPVGEKRYGIDEIFAWLNSFTYNGSTYSVPQIQQTLAGEMEPTPQGFMGYAEMAFGGNAVVFACMAVRQLVFSAIRFQWQAITGGRPGDIFGTPALSPLERPWLGGTTQDLLNRMIQDADLAGNFYAIRDTPLPNLDGDTSTFEIVRLRPDWVMHARQARVIRGGRVGYRRLGIGYFEGGPGMGAEPVIFGSGEFAHFAPYPDPLADWRGMSWLTPVIREIEADGQMTTHKRKFFEAGATPNLIVKYPIEAKEQDIKAVQKLFAQKVQGVDNAYSTVHIGGGADVTVVGANMEQVSFAQTMGIGESRIAAAAGTPPSIVGLSDGLKGSALNAGNYSSARRRMADGTAHPLWQNAAGSLAPLVATRSALGDANYARFIAGGMRLWYDSRDVPFLRDDAIQEAQINQIHATSVRSYIDAGFTAESAVTAVDTGDLTRLSHTGLFSVQLQPPGTSMDPMPTDGTGDMPVAPDQQSVDEGDNGADNPGGN